MKEANMTLASMELGSRFIDLVQSLSALSSLSELCIRERSEAALLRAALRALISNQDIEACSVLLHDGRGLHNIAGLCWEDAEQDSPTRVHQPHRFDGDNGLAALAWRTGRQQHSTDCQADPQVLDLPGHSGSSGSLICTPIQSGGERLGVLNAHHGETGAFDAWQERLFQVFANLLGQLTVNRRLFADMEQQVASRTAELEDTLAEVRHLTDRYQAMSLRDELTDLHNRRHFFQAGRAAIARCKRERQPCAFIIMDIDLFKEVNDQFGHDVGDKVLVRVARILRSDIRESDILARIGGEEFAMAIPGERPAAALATAERIRVAIADADWGDLLGERPLTLSVGVSHSEAPEPEEIEALMRAADQALYNSKRSGRNHVSLAGDLDKR